MEKPFVRQLACIAHPRVEIDTGSGRVFVRGWDNGDVKVESTADKAPSVSNRGDKVAIEGDNPCDLAIYVPRQADVIVDGGELMLDMAGVEGMAAVDISGGQVTIGHWQGDLQVDTGQAGVR